ncbi:hypothetical protein [Sinosporangium siamense]|uniref:Uncharacterized protein n=1 Tax=Sinosporangium siamense TaxID=1367973 RepID=A0A919RDG7_9ACTN|nr:hypothetical protein [Sinosporangium siamense]GII91613.1 hypothetical protein Ssi02_18440 [Sinosporangium siamense]
MPESTLRLPEAAVLVALMVEGREVSNPQLKREYGLTLTGESRKRLAAMKLVDSRKEGRAYVHSLSDAGWARMAREIRDGSLPVATGSGGTMTRALLTGLRRYLTGADLTLAEYFQVASAPEAEPAAGGLESPAPAATEQPVTGASPTPAAAEPPPAGTSSSPAAAGAEKGADRTAEPDIEATIRSAYLELAGGHGRWVGLGALRPLLGNVARAQVDEVLIRMERAPDVNLVPESNQKALTPLAREAAVNIGDQDKHLLWIGSR